MFINLPLGINEVLILSYLAVGTVATHLEGPNKVHEAGNLMDLMAGWRLN